MCSRTESTVSSAVDDPSVSQSGLLLVESGHSRGLLRDCTTPPINRFAALTTTHKISPRLHRKYLGFYPFMKGYNSKRFYNPSCYPITSLLNIIGPLRLRLGYPGGQILHSLYLCNNVTHFSIGRR